MAEADAELRAFLRIDEHVAPTGFVKRMIDACRNRFDDQTKTPIPIKTVAELRAAFNENARHGYLYGMHNVGEKSLEHLRYLFEETSKRSPPTSERFDKTRQGLVDLLRQVVKDFAFDPQEMKLWQDRILDEIEHAVCEIDFGWPSKGGRITIRIGDDAWKIYSLDDVEIDIAPYDNPRNITGRDFEDAIKVRDHISKFIDRLCHARQQVERAIGLVESERAKAEESR